MCYPGQRHQQHRIAATHDHRSQEYDARMSHTDLHRNAIPHSHFDGDGDRYRWHEHKHTHGYFFKHEHAFAHAYSDTHPDADADAKRDEHDHVNGHDINGECHACADHDAKHAAD